MYKEKEINLDELKQYTSEEIGKYVVDYFKNNPNKTVCKLGNKHRVRKHNRKVNVFYLYMR